jgi:uncharacterized membrane protein
MLKYLPNPRLNERVLFLLLLAFSLFVRFWQIDQDSLWLDEGLSIRLASLPFGEIFKNAAPIDHNPPLYLYILHFWMKLFGKSEIAVRSLSALCNTATIPLLLLIAKRFFSYRAALLSCLFFAISPFQIYYAQENRVYALHALLALLSIYSFLRLQDNIKLTKWAAIWVVSTIGLLYTHIYAWFVLLFQGLYWFFLFLNSENCISFKKISLLNAIVVFSFIPYAVHLIPLVLQIQKHYWISHPTLKHFIATFIQFGGGFILGIPMLLMALIGIYKLYQERSVKGLAFLSCWLIIPVLVPFLLSLMLKPFFLTRYPIASAGAYYIFTAMGVLSIKKPIRTIVIFIFGGIGIILTLRNGFIDNRAPWRTVAQEVAQLVDTQTLVIIGADFCKRDIFDYYSSDLALPVLTVNREKSILEIERTLAFLDYKKIIFIASHLGKSEQLLVRRLSQQLKLSRQKDYPHYDLFDRRKVFIKLYEFQQN